MHVVKSLFLGEVVHWAHGLFHLIFKVLLNVLVKKVHNQG